MIRINYKPFVGLCIARVSNPLALGLNHPQSLTMGFFRLGVCVEGWIKLHRQFTEWEWYTDDKCFRLFIHILLKCNHKEAQWRGETIKRGEMITSLGKLAEQVGMTVQTLRTTLNKLESTGEINKQSTSKLTRITVCKYSNYQEEQQTTNKQTNKPLTNDQQTTNKQLTTNKNDNNNKNEKNDNNTPHGVGDSEQKLFLEPAEKVKQEPTQREIEFEEFWIVYGRKGNKKKSGELFRKLTDIQVEEIRANLPAYLFNTQENIKFRKDAQVYLNPKNEHWNDFVFIEEKKNEPTTTTSLW